MNNGREDKDGVDQRRMVRHPTEHLDHTSGGLQHEKSGSIKTPISCDVSELFIPSNCNS